MVARNGACQISAGVRVLRWWCHHRGEPGISDRRGFEAAPHRCSPKRKASPPRRRGEAENYLYLCQQFPHCSFIESIKMSEGRARNRSLYPSGGAASKRDMVKPEIPDDICLSVVVLGASGDLAKKKTFPALYTLFYRRCAATRIAI